jgi:hypothetical protein
MSSNLLAPSLVLTSALVLGAVHTAAPQARLVRIAPPIARQDAQFAASDWAQRLGASDLAARERAYGELSELARRSDAARDWVREQARGHGELAWTCRLLRRELDQSFGNLHGFFAPQGGGAGGFGFQPFAFGGDPFATQSDLDALRERMQTMFDDLQQRYGAPPQAQPAQPAQPRQPWQLGQPAAPALPGVQSSSRTLQLEQGPDGCKVTVEEDVDGNLEKRTYEASNLQELLDAHPELREKVGITIERPHAFPFAGRYDHDFGGWFQLYRGALAPATSALRTDILGVVVSAVADERASELGLDLGQGLLVQRTEPGTIASVLGIGAGDVLVEINGRRIHSRDDIGSALRERASGGELSVTWYEASGQKRTRTWREGEGAQKAAAGAREVDGAGKPLNAPKQDV